MSITLVSGVNPNQLQASMALATNAQNAVENAIDRKEVSTHTVDRSEFCNGNDGQQKR